MSHKNYIGLFFLERKKALQEYIQSVTDTLW